MSTDAWEVREVGDGHIYVEARTDDNKENVRLLVEDEEDAEELAYELNKYVREIFVSRS